MQDGTDYHGINPFGYVPMLELDDGTRLREDPAILQYIANLVLLRNLAATAGTLPRHRLQEWLHFIGTELHKGFSPLPNLATPGKYKFVVKARLASRYTWLESELADKKNLMGEHFSVADGYLFTVTNWAKPLGFETSTYPEVMAWHARVGARPAVQEALRAESSL